MKRYLAMLAAILVAACVSPNADDRIQEDIPDRASFPVVSDLLDHRCGTLDCHGNTYRNLRIYGHEGLRLAPTDLPTAHGTSTAAEYDETFQSLVALEPETMGAVVRDHGAAPERLTFIRKARGTEDHKGSKIWDEGGAEDRCVVSWLSGRVDSALCQTAYGLR